MKLLIDGRKIRLRIKNCDKFIVRTSGILKSYFSASDNHEKTPEKAKISVANYLRTKIKATGPITVAEYMKEALTNPSGGYYMNRDVFGSKGDFITSPEISQLFGEMIAVWIINEWRKITKDNFQLVELGPGRGTLMKDIMKVFKRFKVNEKMSVHLVEVSPALSAIQAKILCVSSKDVTPVRLENDEETAGMHYKEGETGDGTKVFWYYAVEDIPKKFSVFVAHEFFDAMPIHKYQKVDGVWHEVFIDIDLKDENKFRYVLSKSSTLLSKLFIKETDPRDHIEVSPQTLITIERISQFMMHYGGFSLLIDYGHSGTKTDTFRAFKNHQQQDPLIEPGSADLTADVDFDMIQRTATKNDKAIVFGPVPQRDFLLQLGIDIRLKMLVHVLKQNEKQKLSDQYHMLIDDDKMGDCFKVMSMFPAVLKNHLDIWPVVGFYKLKEEKKDGRKTTDE